MNIAARTALWSGGAKMPTARDYVQDGLIAMWDGIENAEWGVHDPNATVWKDLVGNRDFVLNVSGTQIFQENNLKILSGYAECLGQTIYQEAQTIECVIKSNTNANAWCVVLNDNNIQLAMNFGRFKGNVTSFYTSSYSGLLSSELNDPCNYNEINSFQYSLSNKLSQLPSVANYMILNGNECAIRNINTYSFVKSSKMTIGKSGNIGIDGFSVFALRIYNKSLGKDNLNANYAVDKARFGLPRLTDLTIEFDRGY